MSTATTGSCGLWSLVVFNSVVFIFFAFSFLNQQPNMTGGLIAAASNLPAAADQSRAATVKVPTFSELGKVGKLAFNQTCAKCHGESGVGTGKGPPLLHQVYNPGHHGDTAFYRAVKRGSPQHHWRFGNMPPQPNVTDKQVAAIIRYIRELQSANGIVFRRHRM